MSDGAAPPVKLYRLAGSHYCLRAEMLLRLKRVPYERVNLTYLNFAKVLRPLSMQDEVPLLMYGDKPVVWRGIPAFLDQEYPEPALVPKDRALAEVHDTIEEWADLHLGHLVRRLGYGQLKKDAELRRRFFGSRTRAALTLPVLMRRYGVNEWVVDQDDQVLDAAVERLSGMLERNGNLLGKDLTRADVAVAALLSPLFRTPHYQARHGESRLWKWAEARVEELKPRRPTGGPSASPG